MVIHPLIGRSLVWSYRTVHLAPLALIFWPFPMTWLAVILAAFWPVWTMLVWLFESTVLGQRFGLTVTQKARNTMRAADMGDADAQYRLAGYFDRGEEGLQAADSMCDEAKRWYEKAATQGHRAAHWYRKAAEQGHVTAQGRLGEMYRTGNGVTRNVAAARRWLSRALTAAEAAQAKADETEDVLMSAERKADIRAWKAGLDQLQGGMSGEGDAASKG